MGLTFNLLRIANRARLPLFKNKAGFPAHSNPHGADWSVADWFQAFIGECGEFASLRLAYENGVLSEEDYRAGATKELADIQTYLDILAQRAFDRTVAMHKRQPDAAQLLLGAMANVGEYANERKKFDRGDSDAVALIAAKDSHLSTAIAYLRHIMAGAGSGRNETVVVHPEGVDLGQATIGKFNEVSDRIGVDVRIEQEGRLVVVDGVCAFTDKENA